MSHAIDVFFGARSRTYYAEVHMPSTFRAYASTGVGTSSYLFGSSAFGFGGARAIRRLEKRFVRHACRDSRRMRMEEAKVEFSIWPKGRDEEPYRVVTIQRGEVVADERTSGGWVA